MKIASNMQRKVAVLSEEARRSEAAHKLSDSSRPRVKARPCATESIAPGDAAGELEKTHPLEPLPPPPVKVLLVDGDPAQIRRALIELERHGVIFEHAVATTESELSEQLRIFVPDVIVCDCGISGLSGLSVLNLVRLTRPATPVVMVSSRRAQEDAIESLRWGATDYLLKSNWRRLGPAVQRAAEEARARVELTLRMEQLARCDAVTGLPYLTYVREQMQDLLHGALAAGEAAAIVVLKIDGLHVIEERFGRAVADEALRNIAGILLSHSPACDCIGRLDRGEFVVAFSGLEDAALEALIPRLLTRINSLRLLESDALLMSASAGVALCPQDQTHFEGLLSQAVTAQRVAGFSATASWRYYSDEMVSSARQRRQLQCELRDAIGGNEFCLFYQPQFEVHTGRICGIEALARWFPRRGESVAPSMFVPLAEEAGLIGQLGTWALREACQTAGRWGGARARERPVLCVNVSTRQITPEFTAELAAILDASGLPGAQLELEITESVLHRDGDLMMDCLAAWKRLGVRIAVDDFGTGYSSLSYLSRLPLDRLKIDRSLTQRMTSDARDVAIVRTIIALGRELGFTVLAEGIETQEQLAMLHELGCQQAQGYLLGRPMPATELAAFVGRGAQRKRPVSSAGQAGPGRLSKARGTANRLKAVRLTDRG